MAAAKKNNRMQQLEQKIREMYPNLQYLLDDPDGFFGQEIRNMLFTAVRENWTEDKFRAEFLSSKYYDATADKLREWDARDPATKRRQIDLKMQQLRGQYGDVFGTPENLWVIARDVLRNDMSGNTEAFFVYSQLKDAGRTNFFDETPDARAMKELSRRYFYSPSMDEITSVLIGETQVVDYENRLKSSAKVNFPHLRDAIDMGLTLEDVAKPRRRVIQETLELDDFEIDFMNPKYMRLLEPSEKGDGPMSIAEVMRVIKTDPSYGYQYTNQANKAATSLGAVVARMFGAIQ